MTEFPGPIPFTGVSELALEVPDLAVAEQFYTEVLGLPVVERWSPDHPAGEAVWVMAGPRTRIGLWTPMIGIGKSRGGVHVHFVLHIDPEHFDAALERIRSHGHEVLLLDPSPYGPSRLSVGYVTDPAGHVLEIWPWDVSVHLDELARGESPGSR